MADFDAQQAQAQAQAHQFQFEQDQARIAFLEQNVANISQALRNMQNVPPPPPPHQPNLNLSPPPPFSGYPLQLPTFKMKLFHFLVGNRVSSYKIVSRDSLQRLFCTSIERA